MTAYDLLFLGVSIGSLGGLILATILAATGRWRRAGRLGAVVLAVWLVYAGVLVAVSLSTPARLLTLGEDRCYDDWCIAVVESHSVTIGSETTLTVTLRLSSRARRVTQRENGLIVYVLDGTGRRTDPRVETESLPLNTVLQPGEKLETTRVFELPAGVRDLALVLDRVGWDRVPGLLIIGDDSSWLHAPARIHLPGP